MFTIRPYRLALIYIVPRHYKGDEKTAKKLDILIKLHYA